MIETGTILQNRYLVEKQIGAGGMGAVYLAVDQRFESYVAIKETFYKHDELGDAFEREAKLLNGLHHPNLPHVSDYFTEGGGHFLVMQFIEGEDLFEILKRDGAFPQADVLRWTNSLLDALDYLHSQQPPIIHRDIKPQNLKITLRGDIILLDFGLAKLNSDDTQAQLSVFGYSRKYSPLEQIQGTGTDARSDIFALGATVYHLLTGKPPIDVLARASAIVAGNPDPLVPVNEIDEEIPIAVANILNKALALNVAARFDSAKAARQALEIALNSDINENAEALLPPTLAAVSTENEIINAAETENFPALEAFAADVAANNSVEADGTIALQSPEIQNAQAFAPAPPASPNSTLVFEEATRVSPRRARQSRFSLAALLLLLSCVGLAAGYFITKANSSNEAIQSPIAEPSPASISNIEQSAIVSDSPAPEISELPLLEKPEQPKTARVKTEPITDKRETVVRREIDAEPPPIETTERAKPAVEKSQTSRPASKQNARRSEPVQNGETRSRVIEAPVPDIESIFTGRPSGESDENLRRQAERRRQRQQINDEEVQEMRRQKREERRRRGNVNNFPF